MVGEISSDLLIELAYALGIGVFVGLEREHHHITRGSRTQASPAEQAEGATGETILGVRTFALLSLFGWGCAHAGLRFAWLPPVGLLVVGGFVVASYFLARDQGLGLTTEVAALVTFLLGLLVASHRPLAVALALATTLLLISKPFVSSFVAQVRRVELSATIQLLILLAIVLPLLPAEPIDPWQAIPPRKIGLFVILVGGIGYVGYVLSRILGQRRSAGLTGLVGGLTSSTAVTAAMAQAGRRQESMRVPGQLATFLANSVMFPRVLIVTAVLSRDVAIQLAYPLVAMCLVMLVGALWKWRSFRAEAPADEDGPKADAEPMFENPFALLPALKWGAILCGVLLLAAAAKEALGESGLLAASAASGLADVDAITLAVAQQASNGTLDVGIGSLAIAIAVISNTVVKGGIALVAGGRPFGLDVAKIFAASILVGALVALRVVIW